ncbi:hypothetical protein F53441_5877 [Fusarium austroafricanum]|uniref:Uncharacterized protein n=1 Tax=Fusarium austroafricanum TaxID=2364996 RepID=A0A8H4P7R4_9HYPO|nr:hypothetical protein F53441_5877 [Fusarium austroafricanum]
MCRNISNTGWKLLGSPDPENVYRILIAAIGTGQERVKEYMQVVESRDFGSGNLGVEWDEIDGIWEPIEDPYLLWKRVIRYTTKHQD